MSHTLDLLATIEHGTVAGYQAGCHGSATSCGASVSCAEVHRRYQGDYGFRKRVNAGESPADIVAAELADADARRARDRAAARAEKKANAVQHDRSERKARARKTAERAARPDGKTVLLRDDIIRLHGEGLTDSQIAAQLGEPLSTIHYIRNRRIGLPRNVPLRQPRLKEPSAREARRQQIRDLHAEGATDQEIADALGMTRNLASQARLRLGLPVNWARGQREPGRPSTREIAGHGTNASYARGCRCEDCHEAHKAYHRAYRERRQLDGAGEYHGTAYGYQLGCRGGSCPKMPSCTEVMLEQERARRRAAGIPAKELVDAAPVRAHLVALKAAGMTGEQIAETAGVPWASVKSVLHSRGVGRPPVETLLAERAAALLAVRAEGTR